MNNMPLFQEWSRIGRALPLLIRGYVPTLLECIKCGYLKTGDASPFSRLLSNVDRGRTTGNVFEPGEEISTCCACSGQAFFMGSGAGISALNECLGLRATAETAAHSSYITQ
jgi:hypothetical protein